MGARYRVGVIGPNRELCDDALYRFGIHLGRALAAAGHLIICGGEGGFMEAVCRGAKTDARSYFGQTIGFLPGNTTEQANAFVDVPLPTGMGVMRNALIVRAAEVLIAAGGGAGTLSELAFAWQHGKKVLCVTTFGGWAAELAHRNLDSRFTGLFIPVSGIEEIISQLAL